MWFNNRKKKTQERSECGPEYCTAYGDCAGCKRDVICIKCPRHTEGRKFYKQLPEQYERESKARLREEQEAEDRKKEAEDLFELMSHLDIEENLDYLIHNHVDVDKIVNKMPSYALAWNTISLLERGADADNLARNLDSGDVSKHAATLLHYGARANLVLELMCPDCIYKRLQLLVDHGVSIDAVVDAMPPHDVIMWQDVLLRYGADIERLKKRCSQV